MSFLTTQVFGELLVGLRMTVILIAASAPLGLALGVLVALAGVHAPLPFRWLSHLYRSVLRGTPLLVQLFLLYYGLPRLGPVLSPLAAAVFAFGMCSGAYHAEYLRGALLSIPSSQFEAARALGLGRRTALLRVVFPQAFRRALPGCTNEVVYLVKYSSLAYLVTLVELTGAGRQIAYRTFRFFEVFLVVGVIYLLLVAVVAAGARWIERRVALDRPTHSAPAPAAPLGRPDQVGLLRRRRRA
ncbi:MAG: amino acid ABC transporter permease [Candidatus Bipolaricaulota bacterium]